MMDQNVNADAVTIDRLLCTSEGLSSIPSTFISCLYLGLNI